MMACRHLGYVVTEGPKHTTVSALLLRPIHRSAWKMNSRKFAPEAATWQMRLLPHACYHGCVVQPGGADHPALLGEQEGNVSDSTTTVRWAAASILVVGVLYALYGLLNPLIAPSLVWFLLGPPRRRAPYGGPHGPARARRGLGRGRTGGPLGLHRGPCRLDRAGLGVLPRLGAPRSHAAHRPRGRHQRLLAGGGVRGFGH